MPTGSPHFETPEALLKAFKKYVANCEKKNKPLTISGFCNYIDSYKNLVNEYSKKDAFSGTIKKIYSLVENDLEERALTNSVNPSVAIFSLKNNFGWKDKQEVEQKQEINLNVKDLRNKIIDDIENDN